jgi:hypothetical protein
VILIVITIFVYIKLAFPFWNIQPVYHPYDFWRALYTKPFFVHKKFSTKMMNRFCNLDQVRIVPYVDATDEQKKVFVNMLQCFWLPSENSIFVFNIENLETYFSGHLFSSYLSFYFYTLGKKNRPYVSIQNDQDPNESSDPVACISSRSGELFVHFGSNNTGIPIYYIDFLCIKRDMDKDIIQEKSKNKKKIMRTLLQTHIYKHQLIDHFENTKLTVYNPVIVSFFRREHELLTGIIPIVRFQTVYYDIPKIHGFVFPPDYICSEINHANMDSFIDFLENNKPRFSIFLRTDIANLVGLIKAGILYVYCLKKHETIYAVYIFRDTRSNYDDCGSILQLVVTMNNGSQELFVNGFLHSIQHIMKKMNVYKTLMVDEIGDNMMVWKGVVIDKHWTAYYLYNMIFPRGTIPGSQFFFLF